MANKLPWFTHDHNSRNDDFIHRSFEKFDHFGYSAYFRTLEVMHEHGVGDRLVMTKSRLCIELRSRWPRVLEWLEFAKENGKISFRVRRKSGGNPDQPRLKFGSSRGSARVEPGSSADEVELQIKKFRERHSKMKSNLLSTFRQPSVNLPLEGDVDVEGEREKKTAAAPSAADLSKLADKLSVKTALKKSDDEVLSMQMPFGVHRGRQVIDIPAEDCAWHLENTPKLGLDLRRALQARVKLKADEAIPARKS